jgi:hypothetical protein
MKIVRTAALASLLIALPVTAANGSSSARYGGLGSTKAAFLAQNPHGKLPPPLGVAYYAIDRVRGGRVIDYDVITNFKPPASSRGRIALLAGINLPTDATQTRINRSTCIVWKSAKLKKLTGMRYAAGITWAGSKIARMRAERVPHCGGPKRRY